MDTNKQPIDDLIRRQLDGAALTAEEQTRLLGWLQTSDTNRQTYLEMRDAWAKARQDEVRFDTAAAYEKMQARIEDAVAARNIRRQRTLRVYAFAAAAACLILVFTGYFWPRPAQLPEIQNFVRMADDPEYTQEKVRLVLSERKTLLLNEKKTTIRYDSTAIQINGAEKLISKKEAAAFNQLIVPYGKQSKLTLSDGSVAWINAGSRLVYPVVFSEDKREIFVEGEVYLEVAHDTLRPFTVHTSQMNIRVLGTKFYVSSYGKEQTQEVVLRSGSVSVAPNDYPDREIRITPDQQAVLNGEGTLDVHTVRSEDYISWIYGYYRFENDRMDGVLARLARYYNRQIECSPEVASLTLSGKLQLCDDLGEVLRLLSLAAPVRLHISGIYETRIMVSTDSANP